MKSYNKFINIKQKNNSLLAVGLDTDINLLPISIPKTFDGMLEFNRRIIEATKDLVCAYKINFAFYEQFGLDGIEVLKKTFELIPEEIFTIADAKRGDIGNTSKSYAKSVFDYFNADSITVNPYMGNDSVSPFLDYTDKFVFLLAITSNPSSMDFQRLYSDNIPVYQHVINKSSQWADETNLGYVVGATHPEELKTIRNSKPNRVFLIPGVGAQGADSKATIAANNNGLAIINASRAVIYASKEADFDCKARDMAEYFRKEFLL